MSFHKGRIVSATPRRTPLTLNLNKPRAPFGSGPYVCGGMRPHSATNVGFRFLARSDAAPQPRATALPLNLTQTEAAGAQDLSRSPATHVRLAKLSHATITMAINDPNATSFESPAQLHRQTPAAPQHQQSQQSLHLFAADACSPHQVCSAFVAYHPGFQGCRAG